MTVAACAQVMSISDPNERDVCHTLELRIHECARARPAAVPSAQACPPRWTAGAASPELPCSRALPAYCCCGSARSRPHSTLLHSPRLPPCCDPTAACWANMLCAHRVHMHCAQRGPLRAARRGQGSQTLPAPRRDPFCETDRRAHFQWFSYRRGPCRRASRAARPRSPRSSGAGQPAGPPRGAAPSGRVVLCHFVQ